MLKKIKILHRYNNTILYEYECENNSIKKTLEKAIVEDANLSNANLYNANLSNANLYNADLYNANLSNANLSNANLSNANLEDANLSNANLEDAQLRDMKSLRQIIPETGSFNAWKKACGYVLKLEIPTKMKRTCNIKSRKCRGQGVKTLQIQNIDGTKAKGVEKVHGDHDKKTIYEIGKMTYPDKYDDNFLEDCTNGIHFFISREEAVKY